MDKEQKLFKKLKKLCLKIVKFGAELDKYNISLELTYQNETFLKRGSEHE